MRASQSTLAVSTSYLFAASPFREKPICLVQCCAAMAPRISFDIACSSALVMIPFLIMISRPENTKTARSCMRSSVVVCMP